MKRSIKIVLAAALTTSLLALLPACAESEPGALEEAGAKADAAVEQATTQAEGAIEKAGDAVEETLDDAAKKIGGG
ncbi:MAG: hypothetical protein HKO59_13295 [Phycisphaerales bacterium]|nr:hypothetical protein [Phycisphaerae bacterium]NNF42293.1 hypothetical protein [Phycisphaerales bacterium]NNM26937.1 hypothetical protein [Phycisphaerales bacterium]